MRVASCCMKDGCMSTTNPIETMIEPWDDIDPAGALDRAPRGRNESGFWMRRHDEYGNG